MNKEAKLIGKAMMEALNTLLGEELFDQFKVYGHNESWEEKE